MNWNDLSYDEKLACISLFPENAKKDENSSIRQAWYNSHSDDEDAKTDDDSWIRKRAEIYFRVKKQLEQEKSE